MERTFNLLLSMASCWLVHLVNYVRFKSLQEPKYNLVSSVVEPWVPEAFLARFPVAAYVLYCEPSVFFSGHGKPLVASALPLADFARV